MEFVATQSGQTSPGDAQIGYWIFHSCSRVFLQAFPSCAAYQLVLLRYRFLPRLVLVFSVSFALSSSSWPPARPCPSTPSSSGTVLSSSGTLRSPSSTPRAALRQIYHFLSAACGHAAVFSLFFSDFACVFFVLSLLGLLLRHFPFQVVHCSEEEKKLKSGWVVLFWLKKLVPIPVPFPCPVSSVSLLLHCVVPLGWFPIPDPSISAFPPQLQYPQHPEAQFHHHRSSVLLRPMQAEAAACRPKQASQVR